MDNEPVRLHLIREHDEIDVLLIPHKDGSGWSYVNMTKKHICPCVFPDKAAALADLIPHGVCGYEVVEWL